MAFPGSRDGGSNESDGDGDGDGIRTENTLWALKAKEGLPQAIIASCSKILDEAAVDPTELIHRKREPERRD